MEGIKNNKYRIIISGGGTGGHIFPAIAIADTIIAQYKNAEILFVGAKGRMEMERVPKAGYNIVGLNIAGLQRRLTFKNLLLPFKVLSSVLQARRIVKDFKPHLVIGVGGYASAPTLFVATLSSIPTLIQEQNSFAGITNKLLSKRVNTICVAYDNMEAFFPKSKLVYTGNPIRSSILKNDYQSKQGWDNDLVAMGLVLNKFTVLAFGGSLGSTIINNRIIACLNEWSTSGIQVILQTGKNHFENTQRMIKAWEQENNVRNTIHLLPFIDDMNAMYKMSDIIVCRSGALSIAELCIVGKPVVFIPSPHVAEDHQTHNARVLVEQEAAMMVKESDDVDVLKQSVLQLAQDADLRKKLSSNIIKLAKPNATQDILREIDKLLNQPTRAL